MPPRSCPRLFIRRVPAAKLEIKDLLLELRDLAGASSRANSELSDAAIGPEHDHPARFPSGMLQAEFTRDK